MNEPPRRDTSPNLTEETAVTIGVACLLVAWIGKSFASGPTQAVLDVLLNGGVALALVGVLYRVQRSVQQRLDDVQSTAEDVRHDVGQQVLALQRTLVSQSSTVDERARQDLADAEARYRRLEDERQARIARRYARRVSRLRHLVPWRRRWRRLSGPLMRPLARGWSALAAHMNPRRVFTILVILIIAATVLLGIRAWLSYDEGSAGAQGDGVTEVAQNLTEPAPEWFLGGSRLVDEIVPADVRDECESGESTQDGDQYIYATCESPDVDGTLTFFEHEKGSWVDPASDGVNEFSGRCDIRPARGVARATFQTTRGPGHVRCYEDISGWEDTHCYWFYWYFLDSPTLSTQLSINAYRDDGTVMTWDQAYQVWLEHANDLQSPLVARAGGPA